MGEERDEPRSETDSRHDELPISPCDSACSSPASSIAATPSPCNSTTSEDSVFTPHCRRDRLRQRRNLRRHDPNRRPSPTPSVNSDTSDAVLLFDDPSVPAPPEASSVDAASNKSLLFDAVRRGDVADVAAVLLRLQNAGKPGFAHRGVAFVAVNSLDHHGQTPLHAGCLLGNLDVVKLLVRYGADVWLANRDGWSPLHLATFSGNYDLVSFLVSAMNRGNRRVYSAVSPEPAVSSPSELC
ncbi:unnamed protein product [Notodromas monacha]|uniref:Notch-regulated ankyrin repeat-containing protein n=1 Tax=Notodromas monacha TaxID=399045 RepID=A0A7R9BK49_9CRUS|nr:unnamed protein product [Notodromas monacha]CAG0915464.1 unnamed protein product [Notodromas monacha]